MSIPCHCGECCFLDYEGIDGNGYCALQKHVGRNCSDRCDLDHTVIPKDCLLKGLRYYQKWRRGANIKPPAGYVIGKLIDSAIFQLRQK